jgi:hypothetical protein
MITLLNIIKIEEIKLEKIRIKLGDIKNLVKSV